MYRTYLLLYFLSIVSFSKWILQNMPSKAKKWHDLSHEQYLCLTRLLNICLWVFKAIKRFHFYVKNQLKGQYSGFKRQFSILNTNTVSISQLFNGMRENIVIYGKIFWIISPVFIIEWVIYHFVNKYI